MDPSCSLRISRLGPAKSSVWRYNKPSVDQACSVKRAVYWSRSFSRLWGIKNAKKNLGQYTAILTEQTRSIAYTVNPLLSPPFQ